MACVCLEYLYRKKMAGSVLFTLEYVVTFCMIAASDYSCVTNSQSQEIINITFRVHTGFSSLQRVRVSKS